MKFRDLDGQFKDIVIKTGDTLPVGSVVEYEGSTPPAGWSKLSDGGSVIVSSEEPTTGEEVWLEKGKNLFDTRLLIPGGWDESDKPTRVAWGMKIKKGVTYTITNYSQNTISIFETTNLKQSQTDNSVLGEHGKITGVGTMTITTLSDCYLRLLFSTSKDTNISVSSIFSSDVQIEEGDVATSYEPYTRKIHTNTGNGYEEFYNEAFIKQIQESMRYLNGYIYSFKTIYYSANTDTVNDANKFVSGLHIIDTNVTIANRPSKKNSTLEAVLVFTGNPNGSGDNGIQIWFNGVDTIYVRQKTWGAYTGWKQISVL